MRRSSATALLALLAAALLSAPASGQSERGPDDGGAPPVEEPPFGETVFAKRSLGTALRRGLPGTVTCDEPCTAAVTLTISGRDARRYGLSRSGRRRVTVARGSAELEGAEGPIRARFTRAAKRRLRPAPSIVLTVRTSLTDVDGYTGVSSSRIRLRR